MNKSKSTEVQLAFALKRADTGTSEGRSAARRGSTRLPFMLGARSIKALVWAN